MEKVLLRIETSKKFIKIGLKCGRVLEGTIIVWQSSGMVALTNNTRIFHFEIAQVSYVETKERLPKAD